MFFFYSISAPSYTMYDDVKSSEVSLVRKPEIRTEIDTQEYKTERTIKLNKGDKEKANMIEISPGDKVLTPKPYQSVKPGSNKPTNTQPVNRHPNQSPSDRPVVEEPIQRLVYSVSGVNNSCYW